MVKYEKPEVFEVKATRCQRCGGILLSEFGLKNGMGHVCKRKLTQRRQRRIWKYRKVMQEDNKA